MTLTPDVVRFMILALACFLAGGAALLLLAGALARSGELSRAERSAYWLDGRR